jgi:hypothetical protein
VVGYSVAKEPTETPLALTTYAARAIGAKLSFAFSLVTYKAVNPQFSTHPSLPVDPVSPPSEIHSSPNELMVEALGTAPKSSATLNSYHQIVSYLYHTEIRKSRPFLHLFAFKFTMKNIFSCTQETGVSSSTHIYYSGCTRF